MGRIALVVTAVLAGIAGISTYQAVTANQQIGVLESGLATVAGQYIDVKAKYTKLDQLMLKREEAKTRDEQYLAARINTINTAAENNDCSEVAVPYGVANGLFDGTSYSARVSKSTGDPDGANSTTKPRVEVTWGKVAVYAAQLQEAVHQCNNDKADIRKWESE